MLPVSRLIQVSVSIGASPAAGRDFNTLMIAGDSDVISGLERYRSYSTIDEVSADFGLVAPEYYAADLYFQQSPQPTSLMIGRWLSAASAGFNLGGILSASEQLLSNFTDITTGAFDIAIDGGAAETLTLLDFSSVTNLNGVASVISAALTGATCTWTGSAFKIASSSTGAGAQATGTLTFSANPVANDTVVVNGTTVTFVASSPVGNQVVIGATDADTLANLLTFLQQSTDANIGEATYTSSGLVITVTYKTAGTTGNAFTLAVTGAGIAVSGATLSGGTQPSSIGYATAPVTGVDISALLKLDSANSQALVSGYNAETPADCVAALATKSNVWYGLQFAAATAITIAEHLAVCDYVEALSVTRMYGISTTDTGALSALVQNDIASLVKVGNYDQSFVMYSSDPTMGAYCAASIFGRMFSVDFTAQNSLINVMYKQCPGLVAEVLTDDEANALEAKNCNVFVGYDNSTSIIQYGTVASGNFIDEIWDLDWFQNAVQTAVYNLFYTADTKIPQTDAGQNQILNAVAQVCGDLPGGAVYNGLAAPGKWNSSTIFGSLQTGQYLSQGYYIYAPSIDSQSETDRAARKAPATQIALKLAGAFQSADLIVTVNR